MSDRLPRRRDRSPAQPPLSLPPGISRTGLAPGVTSDHVGQTTQRTHSTSGAPLCHPTEFPETRIRQSDTERGTLMNGHENHNHCSDCSRCIGVPNKPKCDSCMIPRESMTDVWDRVFNA